MHQLPGEKFAPILFGLAIANALWVSAGTGCQPEYRSWAGEKKGSE